jgi:hypothetical protein
VSVLALRANRFTALYAIVTAPISVSWEGPQPMEATLTGNGLSGPLSAAFDGERILITLFDGNGVSLWRATDLTPLGNGSTGASTLPYGACSDGLNFWVTLFASGQLARF